GLSPALLDTGGQPLAAAARFEAAERTAAALTAAADALGPLTLVLDDLQWADEDSLTLLRHLCRELGDTRILVLGTSRDPAPPLLTDITGLATVHTVRLLPLTAGDTARYLGAAGTPELDPSWAAAVHRHSGGNPLFLRELVRLLDQEDRLGGPAGELPVPAELRRLVAYRLGRLGGECLRLLGCCAAIGDEVPLTLLAAAAPDADPASLAEAVAAGVLVEDPDAPAVLRFSHGLVRQSVYESLSRSERVGWHRAIAVALRSGAPGGEGTAELARHAVRAAVDPASALAAIEDCEAAAAWATQKLAFGDAARWLRHAAGLLDIAGADDPGRAGLLLALAQAAHQDGQVTEAIGYCERVADLAEKLGRADLLAEAAVVVRAVSGPVVEAAALCERARAWLGGEDSALHARVLAQHAWTQAELGRSDAAEPLSARALAMAERSGDPDAILAALDARHHAVDWAHGVVEHLGLGERALELAVARNRPEAVLLAHLWRLDAGYHLGDMPLVDDELRALDALAGRLAWPLARWHLLRARASRAMLTGDFALAEETALAFREVGVQTQDHTARGLFYAFVLGMLMKTGRFEDYPESAQAGVHITHWPIWQAQYGMYSLAAGDRDTAASLLDRLRPALLGGLPRETRWLPTVVSAAGLALGLGDRETAAVCHDGLLPYAGRYLNGTTVIYGSVARTIGEVASGLGRHDDAVRMLETAVAMEERIGALPDLAIAELALATALVARGEPGDRTRAAALAGSALQASTRLGMAPTRTGAAALADELAGVRAGAAGALTAREREIAALVAAGMANRAIAESLVLSERTVETHVRNVLTKLGLSNRTQVANWAARAGLSPGPR
ncbi:MAG: hypothetical protein QOD41_3895, partial [Cryptosporangiaceae bacterium]|nr:hypothetical protein [Cryptosporangiaceae bacterium]